MPGGTDDGLVGAFRETPLQSVFGGEVFEDGDAFGVELGDALLAQDVEGPLLWQGLVLRAFGGEGVVDVGDGEDAGGEVEVFRPDAAVVA